MLPEQKKQPGFPPCVSLHITFNEHAGYYEPVEQWVADRTEQDWLTWVSDAERDKAIRENSVWTCQWYPDTPVGFCVLAASSFEALMAEVNATKDTP